MAVELAVREIRRLGLHGLSKSEFDRYVTAMMRGMYVYISWRSRNEEGPWTASFCWYGINVCIYV